VNTVSRSDAVLDGTATRVGSIKPRSPHVLKSGSPFEFKA
jgi:hypothetical protein